MRIGIIGGTGFYDPDFLKDKESIIVDTNYGSREVFLGKISGREVVFLSRHGSKHDIPPHMVDYRRNISAIKTAGADRVISINSVGALDEALSIGGVLIPDDFIDFTYGRKQTFYEDKVVHVDMSNPFCGEIRSSLIECGKKYFKDLYEGGVYVCTQGPRFESKAEIRMLRKLGGDVVGMVGYPEVALAKEASLCYSSICTISNYACGISETPLTIKEVTEVVSMNMKPLKDTISCALQSISKTRECGCQDSLSEALV